MPRLWEATKSKLLLIHLRDSFKRKPKKVNQGLGAKRRLDCLKFQYPFKFIHNFHYNRCLLIIYYEQMILNFSLWAHNYTARSETEIKDDKNAPKPDQRQNLPLRFHKLSRDFNAFDPVFLCFHLFKRNGLKLESNFIHNLYRCVCAAIKTRQHALIFYTRRDSQKAITHKFLIMFCLLALVTTRSKRRRKFRR